MSSEIEFEKLVADSLRKAGWRIRRNPIAGDMRADLLADDGARKYVVEVKSASEGRRDRLVPLLAQAILQAQAFARQYQEQVSPLAVVAARHVPHSVVVQIMQFAEQYAPETAVGIVDAEGLRSFAGPGLEGLEAKPHRRLARNSVRQQPLPDLFSDLNQWMLKIVLGQQLPKTLISVPRASIRNASQLAMLAGVSVMSASRFLNRLKAEGFLAAEEEEFRIVRIEELLEQWVAANRRASTEMPARSIIKRDGSRFLESVRNYAARSPMQRRETPQGGYEVIRKDLPRACVGRFAAADALGLGFVRGVVPHLYLERLDLYALQVLGLSCQSADHNPDVILLIPNCRESVFRAAVLHEGLEVSDVLQVWLDVSLSPSRGHEQAEEIRRRALKPLFERQR